MVAYTTTIATLLALSTSTASAFIHVGTPYSQRAVLFADVTGEPSPPDIPPVAAKGQDSSDRGMAIVKVNESSVQFTAGSIGAVVGLAVGGPFLAAVLASVCNYLSRKDGDGESTIASATKLIETASTTALSTYNALAQFEQDKNIIDSTLGMLEDKVNEGEAGKALDTLKSTLGSVSKVIDDNDLVGGAGSALNSVGDLVETGLDKALALVEENM